MFTIDSYQHQLQTKTAELQQMFADLDLPEMQVYRSPIKHYRMRAEFRVWHNGDDLYHIMHKPGTREHYRVDTFEPASELINRAMSLLMSLLRPNEILRRKLFQVDYLSTQSGELVISLLYHKPLDEAWQAAARELKQTLQSLGHVELIGRARKQKVTLDHEYVHETLQIHGRDFHYRQVENSFTQPNAKVCEQMLEWALDVSENAKGDLLELYCGNGNFSIPLATRFENVLATEIAKPSVESAQFNIERNNTNNLKIVRLSSEEFTQAYTGEREFQRLKDIDLASYNFSTIFVDPPRAGLDDATRALAKRFDRILYISCNPETLHRDISAFQDEFRIEKAALFDQFPYTHHAEMGVVLQKR